MTDGIDIRDVMVLDPARAGLAQRKDVLVRGNRIVSVNAPQQGAAEFAGRVIDGRDKVLLPGLVNAHTHSPLNLLKGTGDVLNHPAFMWLNQADTAARTPDEVRLSTLLGCIEHLLSGTTAVIDHFPEQGFSESDIEAVVAAYETVGLRALVALRIYDEDYGDIIPAGGLPPSLQGDNPLAPRPLQESLDLVETAIAAHAGRANGRIDICPAPSNPIRCSDALLEGVRDISQRHNTAVHMHLLETRVQTEIAQDRYATTIVKHLDRLGLLNSRLSCAHTIWIDDHDIALMSERGAIAVHNPESNLKLGTGIAPVAKMLRAGMTVALGTDGASTNDNLDMHEVMRIAVLLQRPFETDRTRWPTAHDSLAMATLSGAKAIQRRGLGTVAPGAPADLILHDLTAPAWIPLNDPTYQLVFGASGGSVDTVIVDGRILVDGGHIVAFDPEPIWAEARDVVSSLRKRNRKLHDFGARMQP